MSDRDNPLINAARGRDACGVNLDELPVPADVFTRVRAMPSTIGSMGVEWYEISSEDLRLLETLLGKAFVERDFYLDIAAKSRSISVNPVELERHREYIRELFRQSRKGGTR